MASGGGEGRESAEDVTAEQLLTFYILEGD